MILIVEDEFLINWTIAEDLRSHGCPAISAFTADEAIEVLQSRFDIDVVFTDIDMPGSMNGLRLAETIRDRWPPIQVIVTSGKSVPPALPKQVSFLAKPYTVNDVVRRVEEYCN